MSASTTHTLRVLHLSDLHERVAPKTAGPARDRKVRAHKAKQARVLGDELMEQLDKIVAAGALDLLFFTGDLADWGLDGEYDLAKTRLGKIVARVGLTWAQVFFVPGNHDVNRKREAPNFAQLRRFAAENPDKIGAVMAGYASFLGEPEETLSVVTARQAGHHELLRRIERESLIPGPDSAHPCLGYRQRVQVRDLPFPVHIIGLDTAWLAGGDDDAGKLRLTDEQIDAHTRDDEGEPLKGLRLALMHHPLADLADHMQARRLLAGVVDLVTHGHQHVPGFVETTDPDRRLAVLAAGCLYEGDAGDHWPNRFHVLNVETNDQGQPLRYRVEFFKWSTDGHFWREDTDLYKNARDGCLIWDTHFGQSQPPTVSATSLPAAALATSVGRAEKLADLAAALPTPAPSTDEAPVTTTVTSRRWRPLKSTSDAEHGVDDAQNDIFTEMLRAHFARPEDDTLTTQLVGRPLLVLVGEPGAGKTFERTRLMSLESADLPRLSVDVGTYQDGEALRSDLRAFLQPSSLVKDAPRFLYIDGLDEDTTPGQRLAQVILSVLESLNSAQRAFVRLRITTRPASWTTELSGRLAACFKDVGIPEVLALRPFNEDEAARFAAERLAGSGEADGTDGAARMIRWARQRQLMPLTTLPLTLMLLCDAFDDSDAPGTRSALYERGIRKLVSEPRSGQAPTPRKISPKQALRCASTLAALALLSSWSPIPLVGFRNDLSLEELAETLDVPQEDLLVVLGSALFVDGPPQASGRTRRFAHHSYAEWLAARWIEENGGLESWSAELIKKGAGVVPQLAEVVSWLAHSDPRWTAAVVEVEPRVVVTADLPSRSVEERRAVFAALVQAARDERLDGHFNWLSARPLALSLRGTEDTVCQAIRQLRPEDQNRASAVVALAALGTLVDLDAASRATEGARSIVRALVEVGKNHTDYGYGNAERAVHVLVGALCSDDGGRDHLTIHQRRWWDELVAPLHELLIDPARRPDVTAHEENYRSARLAYALELLYPRLISAKELVFVLHQPRGWVSGHYSVFLNHVLPELAVDDTALALPLLGWWTKQDQRAQDSDVMVTLWQAVQRLWDDPNALPELIEALHRALCDHRSTPAIDLDTPRRRTVLLALWAHHIKTKHNNTLLTDTLQSCDREPPPEERWLPRADLPWWVEQYGAADEALRKELVCAITLKATREQPDTLRALLTAARTLPQLAQASLRAELSLQFTLAECLERGEPYPEELVKEPEWIRRQQAEHEELLKKRAQKAEERRAQIIAATRHADVVQGWRELSYAIMYKAYDADRVPEDAVWESLSPQDRANAVRGARQFLETPSPWSPHNYRLDSLDQFWDFFFGIAAFCTLAKFEPSTDLGLTDAAWGLWTPALLVAKVTPLVKLDLGAADTHLRHLPARALAQVFHELKTAETKESIDLLVGLLARAEAQALRQPLYDALSAGLPQTVEAAVLATFTPKGDDVGAVAQDFARRRLREGRTPDEERWRAAGLALWMGDMHLWILEPQPFPAEDWSLLLSWLDDRTTLHQITTQDFWRHSRQPIKRLTPAQLKNLYTLVHRHWPPSPPKPESTVTEGSGAVVFLAADDDPSSLLSMIVFNLNERGNAELSERVRVDTATAAAEVLDELGRSYGDEALARDAAKIRRRVALATWRPLDPRSVLGRRSR